MSDQSISKKNMQHIGSQFLKLFLLTLHIYLMFPTFSLNVRWVLTRSQASASDSGYVYWKGVILNNRFGINEMLLENQIWLTFKIWIFNMMWKTAFCGKTMVTGRRVCQQENFGQVRCSLSFAGGRIVLMEADVKPMTLGSKQNAIGRWRYRAKNYKTLWWRVWQFPSKEE